MNRLPFEYNLFLNPFYFYTPESNNKTIQDWLDQKIFAKPQRLGITNILFPLEKGVYFDNREALYINGWTGVHFLSGFIAGWLYLRYIRDRTNRHTLKDNYYWNLFLLHTLWELWQVFIGMAKPWKLEGGSNLIDSIIDTGAFMLGAYLAAKTKNTIKTNQP